MYVYVDRLYFNLVSWIILAIGSASFHATQSLWGELLDEIGMMMASYSTCLLLNDMHNLTSGYKACIFYAIYMVLLIAVTGLYIYIENHVFFSTCFILSISVSVVLLCSRFRNEGPISYPFEWAVSESAMAGLVLHRLDYLPVSIANLLGCTTLILGMAIWLIDQECVRQDWSPPNSYVYEMQWHYWSHSIWHLMSACGVFFFMQAIARARIDMNIPKLITI